MMMRQMHEGLRLGLLRVEELGLGAQKLADVEFALVTDCIEEPRHLLRGIEAAVPRLGLQL